MFKAKVLSALILSSIITGCASVPMASVQEDMAKKKFKEPTLGKAGLYVYRNCFVGQALKKTLYFDNYFLGETANKVYFYKEITPGNHQLSTESEFSNNSINFQAVKGKNYFAEQYIKMGLFIGGANVKMVSEKNGKKNILESKLAQ